MSTSTDPRLGSVLAGYGIESRVGRGGMGLVYRAWDPRLKRTVAVKVINPELSGQRAFRERFLAESKLAASLEHPNVIPIHDAGEVDGHLYLVMRFVETPALASHLRDGPLEPRRALSICGQVAAALDAAHERGLLHRDVKPSNVLLDRDDHVYLADFGLARTLTDDEATVGDRRSVGTPAYVAPEQILGDAPGPAADRYSLGCVLFECLAGTPPFPREHELAALFAHLQDEPPRASEQNPALPPTVDPVLRRALDKDPSRRFGSCAELVVEVGAALGVSAAGRGMSRRILLVAGAAAAIGVAGTVTATRALRSDASGTSRTLVGDSVVRLDPRSGDVQAVIPTGRHPIRVAAGQDVVWVVNAADGTVSQVDPRTNEVVRTTRANGLIPTETGSMIAADGALAWLLTSQGGEGFLTRLGETSNSFAPQIPLGIPDPVSMAIGEDAIWVVGKELGRNVLLKVDRGSRRVVARATVAPGEIVTDVAVGEGAVWVTDWRTEETLWRIDPANLEVTGRLDIAGDDRIVVGEGAVWLADGETGLLTRVDPSLMRVMQRIPVFEGRFLGAPDVAVGPGAVWMSHGDSGLVYRIDPETNSVVERIELRDPENRDTYPPVPLGLAIGDDAIWVAFGTKAF